MEISLFRGVRLDLASRPLFAGAGESLQIECASSFSTIAHAPSLNAGKRALASAVATTGALQQFRSALSAGLRQIRFPRRQQTTLTLVQRYFVLAKPRAALGMTTARTLNTIPASCRQAPESLWCRCW